VAPPAHAIEGGPLAGHPAAGQESSSPLAAVIDELKAQVERLTGEVTKLRAEVDELKVRDGQHDEKLEKLEQDFVWVMEEIMPDLEWR